MRAVGDSLPRVDQNLFGDPAHHAAKHRLLAAAAIVHEQRLPAVRGRRFLPGSRRNDVVAPDLRDQHRLIAQPEQSIVGRRVPVLIGEVDGGFFL